MSSSSSACLLVAAKTNNKMLMSKQQQRINKKINRFQLLTCTLTGPCWGQFGAGHAGKPAHVLQTFLHVLLLQLLQLCQQLILTDHSKFAGLDFCTLIIISASTRDPYLVVDVAKRSGNGIADLLGPVLLLRYILHHVIYLVNVAVKKERGICIYKCNALMHKRKLENVY